MKRFLNTIIAVSIFIGTIVYVYAADVSVQFDLPDNSKITQTGSLSLEQTISNINNTVTVINNMKANGQVTDAKIIELTSQIYSLEQATMDINLSDKDLSDIALVLNSAESAIEGLSNVQSAEIAIMLSRQFYGLTGGKDLVEEFNRENNFGIETESQGNTAPMPQPNGIIVMGPNGQVEHSTADTPQNSKVVTGTPLVNSFCDVKESDWYYMQVQAMVQKGLFAGKGNITNGIGTFSPNDTMSKAEFITVVARMLYKDDEINNFAKNSSVWWDKYYNACIEKGIFNNKEMTYDSMESGLSREKMSFVVMRTLKKLEPQSFNPLDMAVASSIIPDYKTVSEHLKQYVVHAYASGLLCGTDTKGTFSPKATLTRAEASTVLYRMIEADKRTPEKELYADTYQIAENPDYPIIIREDELSLRRLAREGDIFIKADGTEITIKKGPHGVIGEGQGIAPDLGATSIAGYGMNYTVIDYNVIESHFASFIPYRDSRGIQLTNQHYAVNWMTGEGHWVGDWEVILKNAKPSVNGNFYYQLSDDMNFYWSGTLNEWGSLYYCSEKIINNIKQANGLK